VPVYVGIGIAAVYFATLKQMVTDGIRHALSFASLPEFRTSVAYTHFAVKMQGFTLSFDFVESWHDAPLLIQAFARS